MAHTPATYKKIPGKRFSLFGKRSLWQGPDHLLWVEGNIMSESYKRFYFKDIQALVLCRSKGQTIWTILWTLLLLLSGGTALMAPETPFASTVFAVIWASLLIGNILMGPTCDVYLQTAVQFEKLTTLVRIRKAVKVLDQIKASAQRAQGSLDPSAAVTDSGGFALGSAQRPFSGAHHVPSETAVAPYKPFLHWMLFGLLVLLGLVRWAHVLVKWVPLAVADMLGIACTAVLLILVLARSHRPVKGSLVATVDWLILVFVSLHAIAAYAFFIAASFKNPAISFNTWAVIKMFFEIQAADDAVVNGYAIGVAAVSAVLAVMGIVGMTLLGRRSRLHPLSSP